MRVPSPVAAHSYTVLSSGSPKQGSGPEVSALVLGRGEGVHREGLFESLRSAGFDRILYVGSESDRGKGERLSVRFPGVRVLLSKDSPDPGRMVNMGMREMESGHALVMWSDMVLAVPALSIRLRQKIAALGMLCVVPALEDGDGSTVPSLFRPSDTEGLFRASMESAEGFAAVRELPSTLFPYDYCGIYDVAQYLESGGFDEGIRDPWWQAMDFGLGAWMAGRQIRQLPSVKLRYAVASSFAGDSASAGDSAAKARFWLKRLSWKKDESGRRIVLPRAFWTYLAARRGRLAGSLREFREELSRLGLPPHAGRKPRRAWSPPARASQAVPGDAADAISLMLGEPSKR